MRLDISGFIKVDTGGKEKKQIELFETNITHNLTTMADAAGIYEIVWHPERQNIFRAKNIIKPLEKGLKLLKENPEKYKKYNPISGWGAYKEFVPLLEKYLIFCKENPKAQIKTST